ncbi:hypothetical protein M404DRAFT_1008364 [Pisolithus tinctorius Marx 270]|uniref:Uncharacterized protein n=1 Tax=Pisolithus tinctorius Marx 270 TaxID=870435 RepID=A0A0C3NG07_PISTI|nr:hypothetical protein M404DRAFT_1008364 [Pisolithus tinctorius Marx 270]
MNFDIPMPTIQKVQDANCDIAAELTERGNTENWDHNEQCADHNWNSCQYLHPKYATVPDSDMPCNEDASPRSEQEQSWHHQQRDNGPEFEPVVLHFVNRFGSRDAQVHY